MLAFGEGKVSLRAFLSAALAFVLALSLCGTVPVSAHADESGSDSASSDIPIAAREDGGDGGASEGDAPLADDDAGTAEGEVAQKGADQLGIGFVYLDSSTISSDATQNVVVVLDDGDLVVDSAELVYGLSGSESTLTVQAVRCLDDSMLFELSGLAPGSYAVVGLTVRSGGEEFSFNLRSLLGHDGTFEVVQTSEEELAETSVYSLTEDGELEEVGGIDSAIAVASGVGSALSSASTGARTLSGYSGGEFVVAVDPGHGGSDPGAGANGLVEKELTWKIAGYCKELLDSYAGVSAVLTRDENECPDLDERVDRAVSAGARVFVSIHINSGGGTGAEVYYPNGSSYKKAETHDEGKALASLIQEKLAALGLTDRGIKIRDSENGGTYEDGSVSDYYGVIRHAREAGIPGIIVEHAFIDNPSDAEKLKSEDFLRQLGYADAQGVLENYGFLTDGEWIKGQDGRWWYSVGGTYPQSQWMRIRGVWYYFDREGWAATGWQSINGSWYYLDPETCAMKTGWLLLDGEWYWLAPDGSMERGWLKEGSSWYHLATDGAMDTGWYSDGIHWYYLNPSNGGRMETGWLLLEGAWYWLESDGAMKTGWFEDGDSTYYFASNGAMKTGWFVVDGKRYFADSTGRVNMELANSTGWKLVNGSWYYYGDQGEPETGWYSDGSYWYYLDPEDGGRMKTGWLLLDGEWYWLAPDGSMERGWLKEGSSWYHLATDGAMDTGWYSDGIHWYYLNPSNGGRMETGWLLLDGEWYWLEPGHGGMASDEWVPVGSDWYCFASNGVMYTGLFVFDGQSYLADESGRLVSDAVGWLSVDGGWYYCASDGSLVTGWYSDGSHWYYLDPNNGGRMAVGWLSEGGSWYYLASDGTMQIGWHNDGPDWYYLAADGTMQVGWVTIGDTMWRFDSSGRLMEGSKQELEPIMGSSEVSVNALADAYGRSGAVYPSADLGRGGASTIEDFCRIVCEEADFEGVRAEVLFCQAMLETGWLKYGGDVKIEQFNFGGLGAVGGGSAGASFPDVRTGLRAQVQHLKAYASKDDLKGDCVDPRFAYVKRGCAPYVQWLGINENPQGAGWAAGEGYGMSIVELVKGL